MSSRYALGYILLGIAALALFAIPLWYGYRDNLGTFRAYVPGAEMQRLVDIFHRDGAQAAAAAVEAYLPSLPRDEVIVFADPDRRRLAGSLPAWPAEVPDVAGTYGLVIGLGAEQSMRVVVSHQTLPGGYRLLMGRESVRFQSLVERFWYGIAGAVAIVLGLGALFAWRLRRSLLLQIGEIARNAAVIVEGDPSRRLPARGSLPELDTLAQTMNRLLEQQTKYLDELFDLAPDAIVLTELNPSRIVRVNREFTRVFGYTSEEAVGRSLRELIAPGELGVDYAASAAAIAAGQRVDMELVRQRKDGTRLHVHFTSAAIKTGEATSAAYLVYRDITERKLAEQALRASEARFRGLTELSSDWYWEQDENLRFTYLSNQALDLTGYTGESSLGKHRWEIVNMTPLSCSWREHQAVLAAQQPFRDLECRRVGPDGTVRYLSISGAHLR
jgi:PAS domain S-box-containing protein